MQHWLNVLYSDGCRLPAHLFASGLALVSPSLARLHTQLDERERERERERKRELSHNSLEVSTDLFGCPSGPVAVALTLPDYVVTAPIPARYADGSELNQPFTFADVVRSVNLLHRGSSALGFLTVEAFRAAAPLLAGAVAAFFNACAQVGSLPPAWALCAITPIHKSGQ